MSIVLAFPSSGAGSFYFDGVLKDSSVTRGTEENSYDLLFGARRGTGNTGYGYALTGSIDEVIIWNRRLNSTEVSDVYNYF